ncbi:zf-HC2 domain-containing protein [Streptomyces bambusae]|uniref:zf-HC2 domain-containing protein n=1 Tax=Streptomyces bambusae TaxID=1550616 RepID=UPI001CFDB325|nr:zf-HC2 domain-containing protein [Streptomyces bambusae]MCB5165041.1 zf-HC2 domain-containing protein [Streptomyces bambusae]
MNRQQHDEEVLIGPYVLGVLDDDEVRRVEAHVRDCGACRQEVSALREMETALGEVPPEAFLDGPPPGGDLLLQRTLRRVRTERARALGRRRTLAGIAAAAALAGVFWAGTAVSGGADPVALPPVPPSPTATPPVPPGTRVASATDPATGARMTVRVTPAARWVRVHAAVAGLPPGERCTLVVVGRDGSRTPAGSWVVGEAPPTGKGKGVSLDGSAAVDPSRVQAVEVENDSGRRFVSVPLPA